MDSNSNIDINTKSIDFFKNSLISKENEILIDGSILEGGGQILRISLGMSLIFNKKVKIEKIRAGRENPGLKNQHLACILCLKNIFKSEISGAELKSKEISFNPISEIDDEFIDFEEIICDSGSAGSIGLMIQQLLPCLIFTNKKFNEITIKLKGGTLVNFSPSTFYLNDVLRVILKKNMNINFNLKVVRHGIFPVGGGFVELTFKRNISEKSSIKEFYEKNPNSIDNNDICDNLLIKCINVLKRGNLVKVVLRVIYTKNFSVLFDLEAYLKSLLKDIKKIIIKNKKFNFISEIEKDVDLEELDNLDFVQFETSLIELPVNKTGYTLFTNANLYYDNTIITAESLYSEKKSPMNDRRSKHTEDFLAEVETILNNENICFDEYTVDHIIIFMALAKGVSKISVGKISKHTLTAFEILKKFIPELKININKYLDDNESESNIIEIEGIGK